MKLLLEGLAEVNKAMEKHGQKMQKAVAVAVTKAAIFVRNIAVKKIMDGPKTGRMYGSHQASSPGEPPATDTGNLARSISVVKASPSVRAKATINVAAPYGQYLEFGTIDIEPRPFLQSSLDENIEEVDAIIKEEIKKGMA